VTATLSLEFISHSAGPDIEPVVLTQNIELSRIAAKDSCLVAVNASGKPLRSSKMANHTPENALFMIAWR
jgi:hypothetical protein